MTICPLNTEQSDLFPAFHRPTAPPVVRSASKPQQQVPTIIFYDAVEAEETLEENANPEMEAFTAMVNDYLQRKSEPISSALIHLLQGSSSSLSYCVSA